MMREMSYRDKMILLIISVIIILAVGFFALIRPKYNDLVADRAVRQTTQEEYDGVQEKIAQIEPLKKGITEDYEKSKAIAEMFVNEAFDSVNGTFDNLKANVIMDQYVQPVIDESELKVSGFNLGGISSETIEYYYYTPDVLTYSLLESADVNGNYAEEVTDLLKQSSTLSERETAEVMTNQISLEVRGKKENLMTFLAKLNGEEGAEVEGGEDGLGKDIAENAVRVTSIDINDYTFGEGQTQTITEEQTDAEGNVTTVTREVPAAADGNGESDMTIELTFYNAKPIDQPDLGA
ncbi:MAG: hypothetical protein IJ642_11950 [Oscillospiraceae bacterium]|nr:hypothetical protein [Oscillospiraceae bacterium]